LIDMDINCGTVKLKKIEGIFFRYPKP